MEVVYNNPKYWCGDIGYRSPGYSDWTINTVKEFCIILEKPKTVLDIGCAYGYIVLHLNAIGISSYGVDISSLAISRAHEHIRERLICTSAWVMPFKDKAFDFGFSSGVLEHIPKDKLEKTIKEITRVCSRGLIGVSCTDDETTHDGDDETHEVILTRSQWQTMFPPEFKVVSDSEVSWRVHAILRLKEVLNA